MATYDDTNISFSYPPKWTIKAGETIHAHSYEIKVGPGRMACLSFFIDNEFAVRAQFDHFHQTFQATREQIRPNRWRSEWADPFSAGPHTGFRTISVFEDPPTTSAGAFFLLSESVLHVEAFDLKSDELESLWTLVASLKTKLGYTDRISAEWNKPEKMLTFDATDLTKPRTKRMKVWMDHHMVLLHDAEAEEWDPEDDHYENLIVPLSDKAAFVTSRTEWGVTLEFTVRERPTAGRKGKWNREAVSKLSLPSGRLIAEQTTGGGLLEIAVQPGLYTLTARATFPPEADESTEGVERIQLLLNPA